MRMGVEIPDARDPVHASEPARDARRPRSSTGTRRTTRIRRRLRSPKPPQAEAGAQKTERRQSQDIRCTPGAALRVQVVIARHLDEKKQASLPYTFVLSARPSSTCPAEPGTDAHGRRHAGAGGDVRRGRPERSRRARRSSTRRWARTSTARPTTSGTAASSSSSTSRTRRRCRPEPGAAGRRPLGRPLFRKFDITAHAILRDGQSMQAVAATDPVTGEVVKIDVTMNVVK